MFCKIREFNVMGVVKLRKLALGAAGNDHSIVWSTRINVARAFRDAPFHLNIGEELKGKCLLYCWD